jgi:enamine deaminase RidA (YjgF/YER057c/UK114 family)
MRRTCVVASLVAAVWCTPAAAQSVVKHIQTKEAGIASGVWVGDMLYLSGQLPSPVTPAAAGKPAVYGNTQAQAESTFLKIQTLLKEQGLGMGDIVMMRVYMAADPAMEGKLDFAGDEHRIREVLRDARAAEQARALDVPGRGTRRGGCTSRNRSAGRTRQVSETA